MSVNADQVVVDVAEIVFRRLCHPGNLDHPGDDAREQVALRGHDAAEVHEPSLHREDLLELPVVGTVEDALLQLVDPVVEVHEQREEAVDEGIGDQVEVGDRVNALRRPARDPVLRARERRALVLPDRHEEVLREEAVDLDEVVGVRRGTVDDEEDEVVVLVGLRSLAEVDGVLDRERMEAEDLADELQLLRVDAVEIEPEELLVVPQLDEPIPLDRDLGRFAPADDECCHAASIRRPGG